MYFIAHGNTEVTINIADAVDGRTEMQVGMLGRGDHFGEFFLITKSSKRSANIKAQTFCNLEELSNRAVKDLTDINSAVKESLLLVGNRRLTRLNRERNLASRLAKFKKQVTGVTKANRAVSAFGMKLPTLPSQPEDDEAGAGDGTAKKQQTKKLERNSSFKRSAWGRALTGAKKTPNGAAGEPIDMFDAIEALMQRQQMQEKHSQKLERHAAAQPMITPHQSQRRAIKPAPVATVNATEKQGSVLPVTLEQSPIPSREFPAPLAQDPAAPASSGVKAVRNKRLKGVVRAKAGSGKIEPLVTQWPTKMPNQNALSFV